MGNGRGLPPENGRKLAPRLRSNKLDFSQPCMKRAYVYYMYIYIYIYHHTGGHFAQQTRRSHFAREMCHTLHAQEVDLNRRFKHQELHSCPRLFESHHFDIQITGQMHSSLT